MRRVRLEQILDELEMLRKAGCLESRVLLSESIQACLLSTIAAVSVVHKAPARLTLSVGGGLRCWNLEEQAAVCGGQALCCPMIAVKRSWSKAEVVSRT